MKKHLFLLALLVTLWSMGFGLDRPYLPLKYRWDYSINSGDMYSLDLDGDGVKELYVCSYNHKSYVNVFNDSGVIQWTTWVRGKHANTQCISVGENILVTCVDDINHNGDLDLLVGSMVRGGGININPLSYIERRTDPVNNKHINKVLWKSRDITGVITDVSAADLDNDGIKEILVASAGGSIYVFNIYGSIRNEYDLDVSVYDLFTEDVDNDGRKEIVAGAYGGVYLIDGGVKWRYPVDGRVSRVYARDLDGDNKAEVLATDGNSLYVIDSGGRAKLRMDIREIVDVTASDIDNDSSTEILVAAGSDIKGFSSDGILKWTYPLGERINSLLSLSESELAVNAWDKIFVLETDNSYRKNQTAWEIYWKAREYYIKENCFDALPLAEESQKIFTEINNTKGALDCDVIITICRDVTDRIINTQKLADEYYSLAERYLRDREYDDAVVYAQKAMDLYNEVGRGRDVIKCDKLIRKIKGIEDQKTLENAEKFYKDASYFYTTGSYRNSSLYLGMAKELYLGLNHSEGVNKCDLLLTEIEWKEREGVADDFYSMAQEKYRLHEYTEALASLEQAQDIYAELNLSDKVSECDSLMGQAENYLKAEEYYSLANEYYNSTDYVNATLHVNESMKIYTLLEDYGKLSECEALMKDIEEKVEEERMFQLIRIIAYIIAAVILITVTFFVVRHFRK